MRGRRDGLVPGLAGPRHEEIRSSSAAGTGTVSSTEVPAPGLAGPRHVDTRSSSAAGTGTVSSTEVPAPGLDQTSTEPPNCSIRRRTE